MLEIPLWQSRPVFVTSTFRDMHAERDHLQWVVFPALEERLRERFHHLEPIDLRLGVETAQAEDEAGREILILKVCLSEIERSRPFLIGLLGDRYGWVPPQERMEAAAQEAGWIGELAGRSVTALEVEFGVLGGGEQLQQTRFYLREPLPYDRMDAETAAEFSEAHASGAGAKQRRQRLDDLKALLRATIPERVRSYAAGWDAARQRVVGLEGWGQQVIADLWEDLERETRRFLAAEVTSWQEQEALQVDRFVATSCVEFVGREPLLEHLLALAAGRTSAAGVQGACIVGPAGSGKSSLFAELHRRLRTQELLLLSHAGGIGPRSADVEAILRCWCFELASALGLDDLSGDIRGRDELREAFSMLLARAASGHRVVCLIDALNQLERTPAGLHSTWLPTGFPDNARLIATAIPGTESEGLLQRSWIELVELGPLTAEESDAIARTVARRRRAAVRRELLDALKSKTTADGARSAGNPLWLELALEELLLLDADDFREAELLPGEVAEERLHTLRMRVAAELPADVPGLYAYMLQQMEKAHGVRMARELARLIAVSRAGWRESDLRELLPVRTGETWDDLRFAALRRGFRAHLVQRGAQGQWDFAHAEMREAVRRRSLADASEEQTLHAAIARHLESLGPEDSVRPTELMYHLLHAGVRTRAARYYARELPAVELQGATRAFAAEVQKRGSTGGAESAGQYVALYLNATSLTDAERGVLGNRVVFDLAEALEDLAVLALRLEVLRAAEDVIERLGTADPGNAGWQRDLSVSRGRIGGVLQAKGDLAGALEAFRRSLEIAERLTAAAPGNAGWLLDLSVSHSRVGHVLMAQGDLSGALEAFRRSLEIAERLAAAGPGNAGWQLGLAATRSYVGIVLERQGNLPGALEAYRQSFEITERLATADPGSARWQRDLSVSCDHIGDVLVAQGNLPGALEAYEQSHEIRERLATADPGNTGWQRDLSLSHNELGDVLIAQGDLPGALEAYRQSLKIAERLATADSGNAVWQRDLSFSYQKIGDVLVAQGNLPGALEAYRQSFETRERLATADPGNAVWQGDLSISHIKVGDVLIAQGSLRGALEVYRQSFEIRQRLATADPGNAGWQLELAVSHERIGDVMVGQGNLPGALEAYRQSFEINERLATADPGNAHWQRNLSVSHTKVGEVLAAQGELPGAMEAYRQSLEIRERLATADPGNAVWQGDLSVSYQKIGDVLVAQGNLPGALGAYRQSFEIRERLAAADPGNAGWQRDLAAARCYVGTVMEQQGNLPGALDAFEMYQEGVERLAAADPGNAGWQRDLSVSHNRIGNVLLAQGDLPGALKAYQQSLEIHERLATADPGNAGWQRDLSFSYQKIGDVLVAQGDLPGALEKYPVIRDRGATRDGGSWNRWTAAGPIGRSREDRQPAGGAGGPYRGSAGVPAVTRDPCATRDDGPWKRCLATGPRSGSLFCRNCHGTAGKPIRRLGNLRGVSRRYGATRDGGPRKRRMAARPVAQSH